jgi:sulfur-carrier protein
MDVHILFFAALRDLVGKGEQTLTLPDDVKTIAALRLHLEQLFPPLAGRLDNVRFAQNEVFVASETRIRAGDVVALIPPVAGG